MTIRIGDKIPSATLTEMRDGAPRAVKTDELFAGKRAILFAVPGAFTPTCSAKHLPGFIQHADELALLETKDNGKLIREMSGHSTPSRTGTTTMPGWPTRSSARSSRPRSPTS